MTHTVQPTPMLIRSYELILVITEILTLLRTSKTPLGPDVAYGIGTMGRRSGCSLICGLRNGPMPKARIYEAVMHDAIGARGPPLVPRGTDVDVWQQEEAVLEAHQKYSVHP